ncbi:hypothetical protein [Mycoplasmopsis primatum]|uniref:hypothetical protein n=1 Tax=Mycoplasmopsis primatum TaxID=55604 RepID=UPI000690711E|nr:hypothetical protein [Mycoplasmopsis primatum]
MKNNKKIKLMLFASSLAAITPIISASCIHKLDPSIYRANNFIESNPITKETNKNVISDRIAWLNKSAESETDKTQKNILKQRATNLSEVANQLHNELIITKYLSYTKHLSSLSFTFQNLNSVVSKNVQVDDLKHIIRGYLSGTPYLSSFLLVQDSLIASNSSAKLYGSTVNSYVRNYNSIPNYFLDSVPSFKGEDSYKEFESKLQKILQFYKDSKIRVNSINKEKGYQFAFPPINLIMNYNNSYNLIENPVTYIKTPIKPNSDKWNEFLSNAPVFRQNNENLFNEWQNNKEFIVKSDKTIFKRYDDSMKNYGTTSVQIVKLINDVLFLNGWKKPTYLSARLVKATDGSNKYTLKYFIEVLENQNEPNKASSYKIYDILSLLNLDKTDEKVSITSLNQYDKNYYESIPADLTNAQNITNYDEINGNQNDEILKNVAKLLKTINLGQKVTTLK